MALRLPHVLALMALILAAGVLSIRHLEADTGAGTVPGLVVIDAPWLDARAVAELATEPLSAEQTRRLEEAGVSAAAISQIAGDLERARIQWVAAGEGRLQPFATDFAGRRGGQGAATLLVDAAADDDPALRRGWRVIIAAPEAPATADAAGRAVQVAADYVRRQSGVRAFFIALDPRLPEGGDVAARVPALLAPLLAAAQSLPRTRRTSLVLLGALEPEGRRRVALRFDVGSWGHHTRPGLADLLEEDW
jgi:hypothetical protein